MKLVRTFGGILALSALIAIAVLYGRPVAGFDIQDSPTLVSRPGADISDVYLFPSPTNSNDVVAVMNVHPGLPAGTAATAFFDSQVLYTMKFDTRYSAEAIGSRPSENLVIQFSMGVVSGGTQQIFVYGPTAPNQTGTTTTLVSSGLTTGTGLINQTFPAGNLTVFAGVQAACPASEAARARPVSTPRGRTSSATRTSSRSSSRCRRRCLRKL